MASPELPDSAASLEDLWRVYDDNCAPFTTVDQAARFIRAASILLRRIPAESSQAGSALRMNDLQQRLTNAERWRANALAHATRTRTLGYGGRE